MINARAEALSTKTDYRTDCWFEIPTPNCCSDQTAERSSSVVVFTTAVHTIPNMLASSVVRRSVASLNKTTLRSLSVWSAVPAGPPDPILGMSDSSHASQYPSRSTNVSCHL